MDIEQRVLDHVESKQDEIVTLMQSLIQIPSVTGNESKIGALMERECIKDGLEVDVVEPLMDRVSVVAKYRGTEKGSRMMMYSHYDVVPAGDADSWTHPPFSGKISEGYIWGRGAQDNKVATCGLTIAFRALQELGIRLKGDIVFTHVGDEEKGGRYGFREILDRGYGEGIDYLFYAHGGSPDTIGIAANGSRGCTITVKGRSAHTAQLESGVNAVVHAAGLVNELQSLAEEVNQRKFHLPGTESVMKSRFSVNKIHGHVANNNVPDNCEIYIDRRYTPSETKEQVDQEYSRVIKIAKLKNPALDVEYKIGSGNLVSVAPADSPLVASIQKAAERVIGYIPKPIGGSHSSDHGWFVERHHKPFASYGIGGEGIHGANERIKIEDLISTTKVYALCMMYILGVQE
jgi:acetylornithine deacetylase/succinyl-diaminopimelate desuccinylase family protein